MSDDVMADLTAAGRKPIWHINGLDCSIEICARPAYCNRGKLIATIQAEGDLRRLSLDAADGWPRYYFDLDRAKAEVEAWMHNRAQWTERSAWAATHAR